MWTVFSEQFSVIINQYLVEILHLISHVKTRVNGNDPSLCVPTQELLDFFNSLNQYKGPGLCSP